MFFRRKPRTLAEFKAGWTGDNGAVKKYLPKSQDPDARPKMHVSVANEAAAWVNGSVKEINPGYDARGDVYSMALLMGAFCLHCSRSGRQWEPFLVAPNRQARNLPPHYPPTFTGSDQQVTVNVTGPVWSADAWAYFDCRGPAREVLVDRGLHVLGALALMPPSSLLAVRGEDRSFGLTPPFNIAGAEPFPADLPNYFMPPQSLS